jgi:hypothetical protein
MGRHAFKLTDVSRDIRAAEAAGVAVKRVDLEGGKISVVVHHGDESRSP